MFQSKATVMGFLGDEEKYPCHFQHNIGDEFIWDGEKFIGRLCASVVPMVVPVMIDLWSAGPRRVNLAKYLPFWYAPVSVKDPTSRKLDGLGFKNVLTTYNEPEYHMARLEDPRAFTWPPCGERVVASDLMVQCPDSRTKMLVKLEAFDLSEKGFDVPYFRRQMAILNKVLPKPGIAMDKILDEFTRDEIEGIYPALSQVMIEALADELDIMGYIKIDSGTVSITGNGEAKLDAYKNSLSAEEREALKL